MIDLRKLAQKMECSAHPPNKVQRIRLAPKKEALLCIEACDSTPFDVPLTKLDDILNSYLKVHVDDPASARALYKAQIEQQAKDLTNHIVKIQDQINQVFKRTIELILKTKNNIFTQDEWINSTVINIRSLGQDPVSSEQMLQIAKDLAQILAKLEGEWKIMRDENLFQNNKVQNEKLNAELEKVFSQISTDVQYLDKCLVSYSPQEEQVEKQSKFLGLRYSQDFYAKFSHSQEVQSATISTDAKFIASGSKAEDSIKVWQQKIDHYELHLEIPFSQHQQRQVCALALTNNGSFLASGGEQDCIIRVWELQPAHPEPDLCLQGHTKKVLRLHFSEDAKYLYSCSEDKTFRIWNTGNGSQVYRYEDNFIINGVAVSFDRELMSIINDSGQAFLLTHNAKQNVTVGSVQIATYWQAHSPNGVSVAISQFQNQIATGGKLDRLIKLWLVGANKRIPPSLTHTFKGHTDSNISTLKFLAFDELIASSAMDNQIRFWDVATGKQVLSLALNKKLKQCFNGFELDGGTQVIVVPAREEGILLFKKIN